MKLTRVLFAVMAVAALGTLVGCNLLNGNNTSSIIGSITIDSSTVTVASTYHVVLYSEDTTVDPGAVDWDTIPRAMETQGDFPAADLYGYGTVNFEIDEVPAGAYSVFVWVDLNGNGLFDRNNDVWGFYTGYPGAIFSQPTANVVVSEVGLVDIDIWVDYLPS